MLKIIPLGGLGEIGLNMLVLEYGEDLFVIDAGLMFPNEFLPGIDLVIPDFTYLRENRSKVRGIVLTHGHEDHIGALPFFLKEFAVPVYGTPFTLELLKEKLKEHTLPSPADLHPIGPGSITQLGPFRVEYLRVNHSIVDGVGLAIETPEGLLIHSGDFKIDFTPPDAAATDVRGFAAYGARGVLALLSDSTNAEKEGYTMSEWDVRKTLETIIRDCPGRVIVAVFASNIARMQQLIALAEAYERKVVFNGKSMITNTAIARNLGFLTLPEGLEITERQIGQFPDRNILIITTGSQGEPMSALARMAQGTHRKVSIKADDTVILSSRFIPGNERAITATINSLCRSGAHVIYETVSDIHTSGHAKRDELKLMLDLVRPRYLIPIHGEYRHLVHHGELGSKMGLPPDHILIVEDGQVMAFENGSARLAERVPVGHVLVDGKGVGDVGEMILRDRRRLSADGLVIVLLGLDEQHGELVYGPELVSRGFVIEDQGGLLMESAKTIVQEVLAEAAAPPVDRAAVEAEVHRRLRRFFLRRMERSPLIMPIIIPL